MRQRKHGSKRKRDILNLSLKSMPVLDELICTQKTFDNIQDRLNTFYGIYADRTYRSFVRNGVVHIKRYA